MIYFDGLGSHWPAIVTCGMFNWFKRGKVFQQYALRLGYWVRVKVARKESTLINNSFLNWGVNKNPSKSHPWLCGLIVLGLILPSYYMDYHRSCIGIPQKSTSIMPQFRSILTIFIHRGNGDVSTLDWSEVPEGILHYEDFPIFVSPWKTVVIFEHVFSWKRWWKRAWMVLWV